VSPAGAGPDLVVRALLSRRVTHVVGLPDTVSGPLFDALVRHPLIRLVTVTREGEAFAIAAGLWIGGAAPVVVVQNTGLLESGDALRGTVLRMAAPIPIVVTGRGHALVTTEVLRSPLPATLETLTRVEVDSAALLTEPTLEAWGIPFLRCQEDDDPVASLLETIDGARQHECPAALVLARALT